MNKLDRINAIVARRNWFHLNDNMKIVYCVFDDRGNCHSEFHASTKNEVREMVLDSSIADNFLANQRSLRKLILDEIRSQQISANIRGDHDEDIKLFNLWVNQSRTDWCDAKGNIQNIVL